MDKIAHAVSAEWRQTSTGWVLERSDGFIEKQEQRELNYRSEQVRKLLQNLLAQTPPLTEAKARETAQILANAKRLYDADPSWSGPKAWIFESDKLWNLQPARRAAIRTLLAIGPDQIAQVQPGTRVAFSTSATELQVPITADLQEILRELQSEMNMLSEHAKQTLASDLGMPPVALRDPRKYDGAIPSRVVVGLRQEDADFFALDAEGAVVAYWSLQLAPETDFKITDETLVDLLKDKKALRLSDESQKLIDGWMSGKFVEDPALWRVVSAPDETDPLNLLLPDILRHWTDDRADNLVVCLPDRSLTAAREACANGKLELERFVRELMRWSPVDAGLEGGWFTLRQVLPIRETRDRTDRAALAKFVRGFDESGYASIEASSELVGTYWGAVHPCLVGEYGWLLDSLAGTLFQNHPLLLKFYSGLETRQLQALESGSLPLSQLRPDQLGQLAQLFALTDGLGVGRKADGRPFPEPESGDTEWRREPSEVLAMGLTPESQIVFKEVSTDVLIGERKQGDQMTFVQLNKAHDLAQEMLWSEREPGRGSFVGFSEGFSRGLHFDVRVDSFRRGDLFLREWGFRPGGRRLQYADLPAEFRAEVEALVERYRAEAEASSVRPPQN